MSDEEQYDSTEATLAHIQQVGKFLSEGVAELCRRANVHDHSKLCDPEKPVFDLVTPKLKEMTYGSAEYKASLAEMGEALQHHYAANSHHPEHYADGIAGMDLFDLVEMVADWKAAVMRQKDGGTIDVDYNAKRFGIDPQLASVIKNTVERWPTG